MYLVAFVSGSTALGIWVSKNFPPWYVWLGFVLVIIGIIGLSFMPYYNRIKRKLEIEVEKTWTKPIPLPSGHVNGAIVARVHLRPSRTMQLATIQLECEEGLLDPSVANPVLPDLIERSETHDIEFPFR